MYTAYMIKKLTLALLCTLPSLSFAVDLDGYYITAKGGASKTSNTGIVSQTDDRGDSSNYENEDLGTGTAFGFSVGKYLTDSFRLELEATKRTGYEFDARDTSVVLPGGAIHSEKAKIQTEAVFINGFYDFQPFTMSNTAITPYLGGGVGISRNKMGTNMLHDNGLPSGTTFNGNTINQFAYKLSAGTLVSLTQQLSLDVNYQYVNLGAFKGGTERINNDGTTSRLQRGLNGGEIKTQELMVGLQYKF
jgi:opacity protein-like surface antigen